MKNLVIYLISFFAISFSYANDCKEPLDKLLQANFKDQNLSFYKIGKLNKVNLGNDPVKVLNGKYIEVINKHKGNLENVFRFSYGKQYVDALVSKNGKVLAYVYETQTVVDDPFSPEKTVMLHELDSNCSVKAIAFKDSQSNSFNHIDPSHCNAPSSPFIDTLLKDLENCSVPEAPPFNLIMSPSESVFSHNGSGPVSVQLAPKDEYSKKLFDLGNKINKMRTDLRVLKVIKNFCDDFGGQVSKRPIDKPIDKEDNGESSKAIRQ